MNETEFLELWKLKEPVYAVWGRYVSATLRNEIESRVAPTELEMFLRIPVKPRVKGSESLIQKAFRRPNKSYSDPWNQIEDKVGIRFVVLLDDDVRTIEGAIIGCKDWDAVKARDYLEERESKPYEFDYQSLHYVVRSNKEIVFEGITIEKDMPCEIQVRTLLQHAYSELTHDTIYKPSIQASASVRRLAARSMALIEAADDTFTAVARAISSAIAPNIKIGVFLKQRFRQFTGIEADSTPLESIIIDHYKSFAGASFENDLELWLVSKSYLADIIKERAKSNSLFRIAAIMLVYYSVSKMPVLAKQDSPIPDDQLELIYSDLGEAFYGL